LGETAVNLTPRQPRPRREPTGAPITKILDRERNRSGEAGIGDLMSAHEKSENYRSFPVTDQNPDGPHGRPKAASDIRALTALRGVAAMLVVIYHFWPQLTSQPFRSLSRRGVAPR